MATDRNSLMDYIDETYNTAEDGDFLEQTMLDMFGDKLLDADGNWSDEGPDGMYTNLSNSDLVKLADKLDLLTEGGTFEVTLHLTDSQMSTLKKALSDYSDVTFTKDRQMSKDATLILQQLD